MQDVQQLTLLINGSIAISTAEEESGVRFFGQLSAVKIYWYDVPSGSLAVPLLWY